MLKMFKTPLLFSLTFSLVSSSLVSSLAMAQSEVEALRDLEGVYRFEKNEMGLECRPMSIGQKIEDVLFRVRLEPKSSSDEFGKRGRVDLKLEKFYENARNIDASGKWYRVFDRIDFIGIGSGPERSFMTLTMGIYISHSTRVHTNPVTEVETRSLMTGIDFNRNGITMGRNVQVQTLRWDPIARRISYRNALESQSMKGEVLSHDPTEMCSFVKVTPLPGE